MNNVDHTVPVGLTYQVTDGEAKVTGYAGSSTVLHIPETIENATVKGIAKGAFKGNTALEEVILPETVSFLGSEAFKDCSNLKKVWLPVDLTVINASCFENCVSLEHVQLPYEITRICKAAFKNCKKLTTLAHYAKTGISTVMVVNKDFVDTELPIQLDYLGIQTFMGCESLTKINIPHSIKEIPASLFNGCKSLSCVLLHNNISKIDVNAFAGCGNLAEIRLPSGLKSIAASAFDKNTTFVCENNTPASRYAQKHGLNVRTAEDELPAISSMMIPFDHADDYRCFYTAEEGRMIIDKCEIRPAITDTVDREKNINAEDACAYTLKDGIYYKKDQADTGRALIRMVGDLMCKEKCQESALVDGEYCFDESFKLIAPLIQESDLAIGNMETMSALSLPHTRQRKYVNDRPYLNAPNEFVTSIKRAGFDAIINAQNHIYDAGMLGVIETLDAMNRNQLMHTGVFASKHDKRYLSIVVNGIHIAVVAYYDGARQAMKKAYFSKYGQDVIFNMYDQQKVIEDVKAARAEGAEFIIAYCHWGREYTEEISARQAGFAMEVANAGVDYIFGSHSHCPQPYKVLIADDGRRVPVLFSGGNFLSEINIKPQITRNSLVASLELVRDASGKVVIKEDGYYPCRIMQYDNVRGSFVVVPTNTRLQNKLRNETLANSERNIDSALGIEYKKLASREGIVKPCIVDDGKYGKYTLKKPMIVEIHAPAATPEVRYVKSESGIYEGRKNLETKEAVLHCVGQICYDSALGNRGKFGDYYNFRENFHLVKKCFDKSDFAIGNFTGMACSRYLSSEMMSDKYNPNKYYSNARREYLDALKYAGFDCLAMANPNNLDTGVNGIADTVDSITDAGMLSVGLGDEKVKVFNINDINVGVLSYTVNCLNLTNMITAEGADVLLSQYSPARAKRDIAKLKALGAEFILAYVNCGSPAGKINLVQRRKLGEELGELGADYIICTVPKYVSKYYKYTASDGRSVRIASSLGNFMTGKVDPENCLSAMLRITLYKTAEGAIEVDDDYIPLKHFESLDGYNLPIVPALKAFYKDYTVSNFPRVKTELKEKLGDGIQVADDKVVKIDEYTQPQLTFKEIYKLLGVTPSPNDLKRLNLNAKAVCIATRRAELKKGCVAVLVKHYGYKQDDFQISLEDAIKAKAGLIISNTPTDKVPCIVVKQGDLKRECGILLEAVVARHHPITVAVTGTAGKTTTKELTSCVFDTHYKTLHVVGNYNTYYTCGTVLQKLTPEHEAYIQEVHGGSPNSAKSISELIKPDIAIITNIGEGHLLNMGTIENVIKGKLEIADGLKETGVLIVNNDNEYMHNLDLPGKRIIHYSTFDTNCEYYAQNIQNSGTKVKFQIVCEKGVFDVVLNMQGLHNVGNAIAVFAAGIEAKIPPHKIIAGLTHYVPDADKQNLMQFNGYNMIVDTYSATPISVESAMKTLSEFPVEPGVKKIAVLGDIPALGASSKEKHIEVGKKICKYNFDLMLCVGTDSQHFAAAARKIGKEAYAYEDREAFNRKLAESIHPGDFILFKSGTRSHLKEETIYPLFGLIDKQ